MLFAILLYSALLIGLGFFTSRRVKRAADFYVAGRGLGTPLLFSTFLAANLGAGSTVGVAGFGYRDGLSAWWWVASAGVGSLVLAFFIGPRIYRIARQNDLFTVGDYLELRYNRTVRLLMAAMLVFGSPAILAAQLIAMGFVFNVVAGVSPIWGSVLGGVIVTVYFTAGGLLSSAWVNVVQVAVKAVGFSIAVPWALRYVAGWDAISAAATEQATVTAGNYLSLTGIGWEGILGYAVVLIPSFCVSPGLIQKLYGAKAEGTIHWGVGLQGVTLLFYSFMPVLLGMVAFARFPGLKNPELALPTLLAEAFPVWLGGLMLAAIFSAEVSSADAVLFMLSTSVARDLVQTLSRREMSDRRLLRVTRTTAVIAGLAGIALAVWLQSILSSLLIFYSLLTVSLAVPLIAGLYSKGTPAAAATASIVTAVPVTLAVHLLTQGQGWGVLSPVSLGILVSAVTLAVFSLNRAVGTR